MPDERILVSWIGHADLFSMFDDLGEPGEELRKAAKLTGKPGEKPGPLKTAVNAGGFGEIHLLSNYADVVHKPFAKWLGGKPKIHSVELKDPTDYEGIFRAANEILASLSKIAADEKKKLCILLSPGTPAMAVVWVLLGKSRYHATLYQTGRGRLYEAAIPPALFEEVIPDLIRDRDIALQHLAARNPAEVPGFEQVVGSSVPIRLAAGRAQRAALRDVPVLLLGESGTGKEVFARAIHKASRRSNGPFEALNCAAIPRELLESELFGHEKNAFTGAEKASDGAFTRANGGTLFLDEIGECEPQLQAKLLRVLEPPAGKGPCYREFRKVGGQKPMHSDVRIVAATNRNLQHEVKANRFREDLYYRLAVITLHLPPLRDRKSDIPLLTSDLLVRINNDFGRQEPGYQHKTISRSALDFVKQYHWPGNVRQLYNALLQAAVMTDSDVIERRDITAAIGDANEGGSVELLEQPLGEGFDLEKLLNFVHVHYLRRAMTEANGVKTRAAKLLGMQYYQTLDAQLERLGVTWQTAGKRG